MPELLRRLRLAWYVLRGRPVISGCHFKGVFGIEVTPGVVIWPGAVIGGNTITHA